MPANSVNWTSYARKYDMLIQFNPYYQDLHEEVLQKTRHWQIAPGDVIVDLGAGTGNYSCALAEAFPQATVVHVDLDEGMNEVAAAKRASRRLYNLQIRVGSVHDLQFEEDSIAAVTAIHSLYTFPKPEMVLKKISKWLKPDGCAVFVDPSRPVNVLQWQLAIGSKMIRQHGLRQTLRVMKEGKVVTNQNKQIRKLQADGTYWTHSHDEFLEAVQNAGFRIDDDGLTFRKSSDWVVVTKGPLMSMPA